MELNCEENRNFCFEKFWCTSCEDLGRGMVWHTNYS